MNSYHFEYLSTFEPCIVATVWRETLVAGKFDEFTV